MFPLQQSDELLFRILSNDPCQQDKITQDLIVDYASLETSHSLITKSTSRKRKLPRKVIGKNVEKNEEITASAATTTDNSELKKVMHRDIERQRRREMTTLYSTLRSLLPLQFVKGKRSVSDHMHEAVNYIKQLQANINDMEGKRDKLKTLIPNSISPRGSVENGSSDISSVSTDHCVTVSPCHSGVEILINSNNKGGSLPLSRVLQELLKEGLDVVSCVSAQVNQKSLHRIQSQACDMKCINLHALQRKVMDVINVDL